MIAGGNHLGVDAHADVAEIAVEGGGMSRLRSVVAGLTSVAAHLVIGETIRSRAAPSPISAPIQSCSRRAAPPLK